MTTRPITRRRRHGRGAPLPRAAFTGLVALALLLSACGASDDAADTAAGDWETEDAASPDEGFAVDDDGPAMDEAPDGEVGSDGSLPVTAASANVGRRVIRTAQLVLHVDDPADAADRIFAIAERRGGFIAETDLERDVEGVVTGTITLRVPSDQLADTVDEIDRLASSVPVRRIDETDVTGESTDLEARIRNLTAYERELTELLADVRSTTDRPDDLLVVFERIRSVREEIERLQARLSMLSDQVALSTVSVTLRPAERAVPVVDPSWSPGDQLREAFSTTTRALQSIADAAIWLFVTALPILLVIGAPFLLVALVWRRRTTAHAVPAPATSPPAPSGGPQPPEPSS